MTSLALGATLTLSNTQCQLDEPHPQLQKPGQMGTTLEPSLFWNPHAKASYQDQVVELKIIQWPPVQTRQARISRCTEPGHAHNHSDILLCVTRPLQRAQGHVDLPSSV